MQPQAAHVGAFESQLFHLRDDHRRDHGDDLLEHLAAFLDEELVRLRPRLVDRAVGAVEETEIVADIVRKDRLRSEEHTSELQSLMCISYAVFCLKKKNKPY